MKATYLLLCILCLIATQCSRKEADAIEVVEVVKSDATWSGIGFGIEMSIEFFDVTEEQYNEISRAAESKIQELEAAFSLYSESSELSRLNLDRKLAQPSEVFSELLNESIKLSERTLGYYQPAIHGAWSHMDSADFQDWYAASSLEYVEVSQQWVRFTHPKTQLSFNAIAQGFLADAVAQIVRSNKVDSAILHLGETVVIGKHPEGRPWSLAVMGTANDDGEVDLVGTVELVDAGLAVSAHEPSRKLLNPRLGETYLADRVVAVVSEEGATVADAFATAFAVAAKDDWAKLYDRLAEGGECQVKLWVENELVFDR